MDKNDFTCDVAKYTYTGPRLVKDAGGKVNGTDMAIGMMQSGGYPRWNRRRALPLTSKVGEVHRQLTFICGKKLP